MSDNETTKQLSARQWVGSERTPSFALIDWTKVEFQHGTENLSYRKDHMKAYHHDGWAAFDFDEPSKRHMDAYACHGANRFGEKWTEEELFGDMSSKKEYLLANMLANRKAWNLSNIGQFKHGHFRDDSWVVARVRVRTVPDKILRRIADWNRPVIVRYHLRGINNQYHRFYDADTAKRNERKIPRNLLHFY